MKNPNLGLQGARGDTPIADDTSDGMDKPFVSISDPTLSSGSAAAAIGIGGESLANGVAASGPSLGTATSDLASVLFHGRILPLSGSVDPLVNGIVGTQGSTALLADQLRSVFGVDGTGVKIGVLSDSFNLDGGA